MHTAGSNSSIVHLEESSVARDVKQTKDGYMVVGYGNTNVPSETKQGWQSSEAADGGRRFQVLISRDEQQVHCRRQGPKGIYVVKTNADLKTDWEKHFGGSFSKRTR